LRDSLAIGSKLSKSQKRKRFGAKRGAVELFVGATWPKGAHAHLLEFGTRFMSPKPFMRPAWDGNERRALDIFKREVWKVLSRAAKRLARRAEAGKLSAKQAGEIVDRLG
jgi:HK97 gp10 family phage protein